MHLSKSVIAAGDEAAQEQTCDAEFYSGGRLKCFFNFLLMKHF